VYGRNDIGRLPIYHNLDMVVTQTFRMGGNRRLALQANFDNLLDLKNVTGYYYIQYFNGLFQYNQNVREPIEYFYTPWTSRRLQRCMCSRRQPAATAGRCMTTRSTR